MIFCLCNAINEKRALHAIKAGAKNWKEIHTYFNQTPNCGKCAEELERQIAEHQKEPVPS